MPCAIISGDNPVDNSWHIMTGKPVVLRSGQGRYPRTSHGPRRVAAASVRPMTWHGPCIPVPIAHNRAPDWHGACMRAPARAMHDPCHVARPQHGRMHASCHAALPQWHGACRAHSMPCHGMRLACAAPWPPHAYAMPCHAMPCRPMPDGTRLVRAQCMPPHDVGCWPIGSPHGMACHAPYQCTHQFRACTIVVHGHGVHHVGACTMLVH